MSIGLYFKFILLKVVMLFSSFLHCFLTLLTTWLDIIKMTPNELAARAYEHNRH